MCIIALKPAGKIITRRTLKNCFTGNSDGAGMMWASNGRLYIEKGYFGFRKFYKRFRVLEQKFPKSHFVLHFRIATSGGVKTETCHPFSVHDRLGFVHNGIFSGLGTTTKSDTQVFNERVLQQLPKNFLDIDKAKEKVDKYITTSLSKVVFLDNTGKYTIINEKGGIWDNDLWFSNYGYATYTSHYVYNRYEDYSCYNNEYSGYSSTRKRCIICSCYSDIKDVEWENSLIFEGKKQDGWVCQFCQEFINMKHKCCVCNELKPRRNLYTTEYGEYRCDECSLIHKPQSYLFSSHLHHPNSGYKCKNCLSDDTYFVISTEDGGGYLCKRCFEKSDLFVKTVDSDYDTADGQCPVCFQEVTVSELDYWRCPSCSTYLDKEDYMENIV